MIRPSNATGWLREAIAGLNVSRILPDGVVLEDLYSDIERVSELLVDLSLRIDVVTGEPPQTPRGTGEPPSDLEADHIATDDLGRPYCELCLGERDLTLPGEAVVHARDCVLTMLARVLEERDEARRQLAMLVDQAGEDSCAHEIVRLTRERDALRGDQREDGGERG